MEQYKRDITAEFKYQAMILYFNDIISQLEMNGYVRGEEEPRGLYFNKRNSIGDSDVEICREGVMVYVSIIEYSYNVKGTIHENWQWHHKDFDMWEALKRIEDTTRIGSLNFTYPE